MTRAHEHQAQHADAGEQIDPAVPRGRAEVGNPQDELTDDESGVACRKDDSDALDEVLPHYDCLRVVILLADSQQQAEHERGKDEEVDICEQLGKDLEPLIGKLHIV